jgi:hypothetical protein
MFIALAALNGDQLIDLVKGREWAGYDRGVDPGDAVADQDGSRFRLRFRRGRHRHHSPVNNRSISGIMMGEILGHLGDDLGFGFLCKLAPEVAENFRRRHDHKLVERAGQGNLIDPVRDRSSETFLFEFVPVRLSNSAANLTDAGVGAPRSVAALFA